ncbi:MAG: glycosyltransferase [Leptospiraceae bacterium]|nr:glycosyltransferase [Leptospiraceae bacterium]MDW8306173.1 glycosyltransferase [Leptospiraceae bacterium]
MPKAHPLPRVLQMGKFYPVRGGVEHVMLLLSYGLHKKRVRVDVLTVSNKEGDANKTERVFDGGVRIFLAHRLFSFLSVKFSLDLLFLARRLVKHYPLVHIHHPDPMAALALFLARAKKKQKIILHYHSDIVRQRLFMPLYYPLLSYLLRQSDVIITTSPIYRDSSPYLKGYRDKIKVIPIGIAPLEEDKKLVRQIRKNFAQKKIILSVGRLIYYKGVEYLIVAAKYLPPNCVVIIIGEGPLFVEYQDLIKKEDLENKVFLLGRLEQKELASYYAACDLFCLPSVEKSEAFGIAQVEAMSFGKPVVATNIEGSGVPWVNEHGITGLNVEPRNPQQLARAIVEILEDKKKYDTYARNAKKRYNELFTLEKMTQDVLKIYREVTDFS